MSKKAFIFDLDGVIVDTAKYHYQAWKKLANDLGFDFTLEQNELLKGVSRVRSLEILLNIGKVKLSQEKKEQIMQEKNEHYLEFISKMGQEEILDGIHDVNVNGKNIQIHDYVYFYNNGHIKATKLVDNTVFDIKNVK